MPARPGAPVPPPPSRNLPPPLSSSSIARRGRATRGGRPARFGAGEANRRDRRERAFLQIVMTRIARPGGLRFFVRLKPDPRTEEGEAARVGGAVKGALLMAT